MKKIKKTFEIETSPEVMERIERFFALLHHNSIFGHSGLFAMELDSDGAEKVSISPKPAFAHEVDLCGGVGDDVVAIALNTGYMLKTVSDMDSAWTIQSVSALYRNDVLYKTIPSRINRDD